MLYKDKVYNTSISYLQNSQEAEEITQDVFLTIYNKAQSFKANSKVSTWIYRITVNKALNQLKKRRRFLFSSEGIKDILTPDFNHPGILLENKEKARALFLAINKLSKNQKTAFILSFIEDLPRQEVANIMNLSLKSIEGLLQRAKIKLRKKLFTIYSEGNVKN